MTQIKKTKKTHQVRQVLPKQLPYDSDDLYDRVDKAELSALVKDQDQDRTDPHFQTELAYDGYNSIDEYDNDAYRSEEFEDEVNEDAELEIHERGEGLNNGEEDPLDPQEHRH